ncbi:MAG: hypothetical protein J7M12_05180, partial [Candidatus Hydrogenedentes bacterium]|nr:hypothetical protein [Candidatus Hydrogenedentota bacterium]
RSIRTRDWKLVTRTAPDGETFHLYDLANDPKETKDVFSQRPDVANKLLIQLTAWITANQEARTAIESKTPADHAGKTSSHTAVTTEIPRITYPNEGDTLDFDACKGAVTVRWTGDDRADYVLEYHIGSGWHTLRGKLPVSGTSQVFGPLPRDGWAPVYQWNPFRLRVRPKDMPNGWSEWTTFSVAPIQDPTKTETDR